MVQSNGWNVVSLNKYSAVPGTFGSPYVILDNSISVGWLGALSTNNKMCRFCFFMNKFKLVNQFWNNFAFIHAVLLAVHSTGSFWTFICLKQHGFKLLPKPLKTFYFI
jgi:hypothetical protein